MNKLSNITSSVNTPESHQINTHQKWWLFNDLYYPHVKQSSVFIQGTLAVFISLKQITLL